MRCFIFRSQLSPIAFRLCMLLGDNKGTWTTCSEWLLVKPSTSDDDKRRHNYMTIAELLAMELRQDKRINWQNMISCNKTSEMNDAGACWWRLSQSISRRVVRGVLQRVVIIVRDAAYESHATRWKIAAQPTVVILSLSHSFYSYRRLSHSVSQRLDNRLPS